MKNYWHSWGGYLLEIHTYCLEVHFDIGLFCYIALSEVTRSYQPEIHELEIANCCLTTEFSCHRTVSAMQYLKIQNECVERKSGLKHERSLLSVLCNLALEYVIN